MLELALLGILHEHPMHGYELRKDLSLKLGAVRAAFSYGSVYPTLRRMREAGWITTEEPDPEDRAPLLTSKRGKVVYRITVAGKEEFAQRLSEIGPQCYEAELFWVHFAFFGRTEPDVRLRLLEGRRRHLEEQQEGLRQALHKAGERLDEYTLELQRHGLEAADREVRWLNELIAGEREGRAAANHIQQESDKEEKE